MRAAESEPVQVPNQIARADARLGERLDLVTVQERD
jgi:hypothetical protein